MPAYKMNSKCFPSFLDIRVFGIRSRNNQMLTYLARPFVISKQVETTKTASLLSSLEE